jgi:prepilin-type N-terminal cleavage/methylation domain-containing protein/prepilin-type processing-associated H-X9-DG protein
MTRRRDVRGFTLVELLVVITIIAILIALLLPAVNAARETARRAQCAKNVKEMSLAALSHEQANGHLPTGGWGYAWVGDPRCGFGIQQPGGFFYNILPYIEQQQLHDFTMKATDEATRKDLALIMLQTPISLCSCPSRRQPICYPVRPGANVMVNVSFPSNLTAGWFRGDYRVNGGSVVMMWQSGPGSWGNAAAGIGFVGASAMKDCNGVCYQRSDIRLADVSDGTSNTYLVGEKYLDPDQYYTGTSFCDDQPVLGADDLDQLSWTRSLPYQDTPGWDNAESFGSAHAASCNIGFCDGSVQAINYSIDPTIHMYLGARNDDHAIDAQKAL